MALLVAVVAAPSAYADSFDASFTCTSSCVAIPTDPAVWFPSPIIPISFLSESFTVTLNAGDTPTDAFTWEIWSGPSTWDFRISDLTNSTSDDGPSFGFDSHQGAPFGSGNVCFNHVTAPEPGAFGLMLLGLGLVFAGRKRLSQGIPQAN
jgi:hypothetical protein